MRVHGWAGGNLAKEKKLVKVKLHFLDSLPAHELLLKIRFHHSVKPLAIREMRDGKNIW